MFQKQPMMRKVLISLVPIFLFSLYLYGVKTLLVVAVTFILGVLTEFLFERTRKKKPSEAVLVTCSLYALSMPPGVPLWIVGVGIVFAVFLAKEVYGGFGRNIFNPAIAGRLFVYISFATAMQSTFLPFGNFGLAADAVTGPTPLALMRAGDSAPLLDLILGLRVGSIGEGSSLLIVLAGIYLVATKTANWRLMVSTVGSGVLLTGALLLGGVKGSLPMESLLAGSFLFVSVFMVTDPVTAPKKPGAQWLYGILIGSCIVIVRTFSLFPEGTSFGVFIGNTAACLLDEIVTKAKARAKAPASGGGQNQASEGGSK